MPVVILGAVFAGLFFGMVPGLGGKIGISLCIPLVLTLDTSTGVVFLVAMHAVVHTGGSVPSILLGVPGTGADAATCVDGYPLARSGEAGRALGASLFSSAMGGLVGAALLLGLLPILEPVILALNPAEYFLLAMLGITFVSGISGRDLRKGVIVGCFGIGVSFVGLSPHSGEARLAFGQLFLWEGIDFLTAVLAILAVPEMIALATAPATDPHTDSPASYRRGEMFRGFRDVVTHRWLALRTSVIGTVIGAIPGLGGDAASWICYGHAVQSSKNPERFGRGAVEGVIAPETANNAKEGGALVPTLFFGIPGSSGMAVMLGALVALGLQPGPNLLLQDRDLFAGMVGALIIGNLAAVGVLLIVLPYVLGVLRIGSRLLTPFVFVMVTVGCFASALNWQHLLVLVALGALGCAFKQFGWPRAPFVIGLALGPIAEVSFVQALQISGPAFFLRPVSLVLEALIVLSLAHYAWRRRHSRDVTQ